MKNIRLLFLCVSFLVFLSGISTAKTTIEDGLSVNKLTLYVQDNAEVIAPDIYGHFAEHLGRCVYGGFWVGEDSDIDNVRGIRRDVVTALKKLDIPVLRWPGGCFADDYHWKDGIGPRDQRPKTVNTHWGMVTDTNAFGTHEFLDLCEMLECEAYIAGNMGSGTPQEMRDWVEYMTFAGDSELANLRRKNGRKKPWKIKYFGVGNENWGCGGSMTPEYYSELYKHYQTYVRNYPGSKIIKVACGPNGNNTAWAESIMKNIGRSLHGYGQHYYVQASQSWYGHATQFDETEWFALMKKSLNMNDIILRNKEIMDRYDKNKRVELYIDEWGTWWDAEKGTNPRFLYQQNTLRDAVSAGIFLNTFNNHCDRVKMCNIAQISNVLQAMILTDGAKMVTTPTYHVFEMFKVHQGADLLTNDLTCNSYKHDKKTLPSLNVSASKADDGSINITICNLDPTKPADFKCDIKGFSPKTVSARVLTAEAMNMHNTFDAPNAIKPEVFRGVSVKKDMILATLPAKSVTVINVK
ncbi:MAG: alpha-N-arabinofuranosidase [Planctomycetes bacterium]|nr:alpha-N-arabinofuranosidase [Planctomycetota bacterium]